MSSRMRRLNVRLELVGSLGCNRGLCAGCEPHALRNLVAHAAHGLNSLFTKCGSFVHSGGRARNDVTGAETVGVIRAQRT